MKEVDSEGRLQNNSQAGDWETAQSLDSRLGTMGRKKSRVLVEYLRWSIRK